MFPEQQDHSRAVALSFVMICFGSTAAAATRYASQSASIEAIVTVQYFICTLLCLPIALRYGPHHLRTSRPGLHFFRGLVGVLGFYLFYLSIKHVPMVDALLLRQSAPLSVPLVMWAWNRERVQGRTWIALLVGFVGIALILRPGPAGLSLWHAAGFVSAVSLAVSMVATHHLARTEPPSRILFYYCAMALLCVAPFSLDDLQGLDWKTWLAMLYIGASIYLTLELYTRAYGMAPAAVIAPVNYFGVVLGGFWGWLFWDQIPDAWSLAGSVLVVAGGLLTILQASRQRPTR